MDLEVPNDDDDDVDDDDDENDRHDEDKDKNDNVDDDNYTWVAVKLLAFRPEQPERPKSAVYTPRSRRPTFPVPFFMGLSRAQQS